MLVPHNTTARGQTHSSAVTMTPTNAIPADKVNCEAREGGLGRKVNCEAREGSLGWAGIHIRESSLGWASNPPEETTNNGIHAPKTPERFHCDYTSQQFVKKADGKHDEFHRVVYRPWGHYDSIDNGERHQVKRITVKPGKNDPLYLPIGCVHALENPGKIPLELIEVQSGSYLGEDDIVRFEDKYGRLNLKGE